MRAEQLADPVAYHAEGPGWSDADGRLDEVIEVDAAKTTACCLGGPRLDRLFITTSRENLPDGEDPLAGALFVADVGVRGLPTRAFAG